MSGMSDSVSCPNCGEDCDRYSDYKPFDVVDLTCYNCGFFTATEPKQLTLREVNDERENRELEPLKELPKLDLAW